MGVVEVYTTTKTAGTRIRTNSTVHPHVGGVTIDPQTKTETRPLKLKSNSSTPVFQPSEFQSSSHPTTLLSYLSSPLWSTFNPLFPILLFTLPAPLLSANAHTSPSVTCPPSAAVVALTGVWQTAESKRNPQESGTYSMILLAAG